MSEVESAARILFTQDTDMKSQSRRLVCVFVLMAATLRPIELDAAPPHATSFPVARALPKPNGQVLRVKTVDELLTASKEVQPGGTILIADGRYMLPRYFDLTADQVTLRSESGDRHKVILDGANSRHGELIGITGVTDVTIADVTVQNVKWNGIKINSNHGAERVTIHNCVIHNVWQRGIKAPAMPEAQGDKGPRGCIIRNCLFYNDRPKQFADDETDTASTFNGNYIGGIDVKNTLGWTIADNVFIGIQGRTREGRGCIYISENGRRCRIERNVFLNCDVAIALGNPSLGYSPLHAIDCVARNNFINDCPETGILACYTQGCRIENNTVHDPTSPQRRQIWVQNTNEGLQVKSNVLVGASVLLTTDSNITQSGNVNAGTLAAALTQSNGAGQVFLQDSMLTDVIRLPESLAATRRDATAERLKPGIQSPEVLKAMREVHSGFKGQAGYVAQFGDSITYSMAFWSPMSWDNPGRFITQEDGLPKAPATLRWQDYIKGARDKGPKHANYSGWRVGQLLKSMDAVLERDQPEVAIIMIGTNDISGGAVPASYRSNLEEVIRKCTAASCVPILNTIPPRRNRDEAVNEANKIIRDIAAKLHVPLADFHAEVVRRRSGEAWDGTLISRDGVHPSGGKSNDYSDANLNTCGYAIRNWVNFLAYRQVYFGVLVEDS
jgi:lysophospholipase L1-like esterase